MGSRLGMLATLSALSSFVLVSCNRDATSNPNVSTGAGIDRKGTPTISTVQLTDNVLTLSGKNLNTVTDLKIPGSPSKMLVIQSQSSSSLTAFVLSAAQLALDSTSSLLISTSQATTSVPFTITATTANITNFSTAVNGAITGANLTAKNLYSSKGDILFATETSTPAALTVGTNGQVLTADSTQTSGVKWADGPVSPPKAGLYYTPGGVRTKLGDLVGLNQSVVRLAGMPAGYGFSLGNNLSVAHTSLQGGQFFIQVVTLKFSGTGCTGNIAASDGAYPGYVTENKTSGSDSTRAFYYVPVNATPSTTSFTYASQMDYSGTCSASSGTWNPASTQFWAVTRDTATASTTGDLGITTALFQTGAFSSNPGVYVLLE